MSVLNGCRRARRAMYQHGNRRGCLRGTRETVLNEIEAWTKDFKKSPVFWLNGLAGTGKSTIAQTVAERLFADGLLGASFFCSRDFEDRSDLHFIFPTLAFQLAHKFPDFRSQIVFLLQSNPDVVDESLYGQMERLIVEPLWSVIVPTVILIDAIDECKDDEPSSVILSVLGRLVERIPKVKFLITGRPEPRIKTGFRLPLLADATDVFVLHDVHPSLINSDIRLFLKHELSELAQRYLLDGWPTDESVDLLSQRAAGLFVYAVATVKYLEKKFCLPDKQLETIIKFPDGTGYEGKTSLDPLYLWILGDTFCVDDPDICSKIRTVIGAVVLLVNPLPASGIAELVGLETREVSPFLTSLQSLLVLDEDPTQPVKPFHKSFPDFITDPYRCADTRFYISPEHLHLELVTNCLRVMNDGLEQNLLSLPDYSLNSEVEDLEARVNDHISVALRYACQSWYHHLPKAKGDVASVVPRLRVFLGEKYLAWLEVVSVLGTTRGAIVALERLISWLQEVCFGSSPAQCGNNTCKLSGCWEQGTSRNRQGLFPVRDHIFRAHQRRRTPFPRVVIGTQGSWEDSSTTYFGGGLDRASLTWSPCGQFIAAKYKAVTEIWDPFTCERLSTLRPAEPTYHPIRTLAYSPDGRSLAALSDTSFIIWDIQTGGVAKVWRRADADVSLVWSLDGRAIGTILNKSNYAMQVYDADSGATRFHDALQSIRLPHLWAHDKTFRIMTMGDTIDIFQVGSVLAKIESFDCTVSLDPNDEHVSFSPTTYRIAMNIGAPGGSSQLRVFDIRNWQCLLEPQGICCNWCFSSDGNLFAALSGHNLQIWKYGSGQYTAWWKFPTQGFGLFFQFSPDSSSIAGCFRDLLRVWRLDRPPVAHPDVPNDEPNDEPLTTISQCGTYVATSRDGGSTVAITNLLSQSPSQFIDTGVPVGISGMVFTGNVLLVLAHNMLHGEIVAWRITEEGVVDGPSGGRRADRSDIIWTIDIPRTVLIRDQTVVMNLDGNVTHAYHTGTGEVLEPTLITPHPDYRRYYLDGLMYGSHWPHRRDLDRPSTHPEIDWPVSWTALQKGWVDDREGRHRLWVPPTWRLSGSHAHQAGWDCKITTLWLSLQRGTVIVKF